MMWTDLWALATQAQRPAYYNYNTGTLSNFSTESVPKSGTGRFANIPEEKH